MVCGQTQLAAAQLCILARAHAHPSVICWCGWRCRFGEAGWTLNEGSENWYLGQLEARDQVGPVRSPGASAVIWHDAHVEWLQGTAMHKCRKVAVSFHFACAYRCYLCVSSCFGMPTPPECRLSQHYRSG